MKAPPEVREAVREARAVQAMFLQVFRDLGVEVSPEEMERVVKDAVKASYEEVVQARVSAAFGVVEEADDDEATE